LNTKNKFIYYTLTKIDLLSERSIYCIQQDHGNCNGIIINLNIEHEESQICNCQCHNNMYSLIKKAFLALNNNDNDNHFGNKI